MFFTNFARFLSYLIVLYGLFGIVAGIFAASNPSFAASLGWVGRTGAKIDTGIIVFAAGLALGTLTDISRTLDERE